MNAAAWVPLAAAEVCLLFTLSLARRVWATRASHLAAWTASLLAFTVGAGALWYGTAFGWNATTFRAYYVGGALLGVPWLALGQSRLLLPPKAGQAAFGFLLGASVMGAVLLSVAPLRAPVSGRGVPDGDRLLGALPRAIVGVSNGIGVLVLLAGLGVSLWRLWKGRTASGRSRAVGLGLIACGALVAGAGGTLTVLGAAGANAVGVLIGLTLMYAGFGRAGMPVGRHRGVA